MVGGGGVWVSLVTRGVTAVKRGVSRRRLNILPDERSGFLLWFLERGRAKNGLPTNQAM